uniref:Flagellar outer dynein arm heavy chain beta n=1 Tax=Tetraselmis sp. GSL018 TaxID=582737 RepID=A0A061SKG9_9CHLO
MGVQEGTLIGDVLVAASFVSYVGPFSVPFRNGLVKDKWTPDMIERGIPMTEGVTPLDVICSDALKAQWTNEGLPTDPLSVENGSIMTNSARWSVMIDPQLQGIKWIINREEPHGLVILQQSQSKYIDKVMNCIENGVPLLIENLPEDIDAVLDPVISRSLIRKGRNLLMKVGDQEVEYDSRFKLYLQTKLANPHYKPEINAQATLVNFCVTEKGLEDQLLALVVEKERPDLQEQSATLVRQLSEYTITLKELEDNLLFRLANSQGDILEDIELIENLEETKRTATDIAEKVELAQTTAKTIAEAREAYRPVATRGSLVYFLIDNLNQLDRVYHYSMANFVYILKKGMDVTPGGNDGEEQVPESQRLGEPLPLDQRVKALINTTSITCFRYVAQGLFERHKLIMGTQLVMSILRQRGELQQQKFDFLLRGPKVLGEENPLPEWISDSVWASVQALKELEDYSTLPDDLVGSAKRWKEWMELERPEDEPVPGDWKRMPEFERLLLFRALRPDRLTAAMATFVKNSIGVEYITSQPFNLERSFQDSSPFVPIFVFLSPGVDVAGAVEAMGAKMGFTAENGRYASVSLGQGQEPIAMSNLNNMHKNGGWVLLQNIHLTIDWTSGPLEKKVDKLSEGAHPEFRLFLSAEPPPGLERPLPISLLQASIKLTNEPPEGLKPNLIRAYSQFNEEIMEGCAKQAEFRSIIFALCYFHSALLERKKFGVGNLPGATSGIGWNMNYPFNTGDLLCCAQCANNYLENNSKVPWDDLRYIFGEIMYGGHIVEDWDRRLANAYLYFYFNESLLEGMEMFPKFPAPPNTVNHKTVLEVIEETMPPETPLAFGLHPNAEIGFKLREADSFCASLVLLQPREGGDEGGMSIEEKAKMVLDDVVDKLPDQFDMEDIRSRIDDLTPYVMVAIQESERMNLLLSEMKRSLAELDLGLKGDLTMTAPMESLMHALAVDGVPSGWTRLAYHSLRPLGSWLANLLQRVGQLSEWTADLGVPKVVWLSGLFNPQSFLTAVMQTTARRNEWPLDKTVVLTEVTKKQVDQIDAPSRDGAFIHGLTLEGARWDDKIGALDDSKPKELFCPMPVILVKAVTVDKAEMKDAYQCPVYTTEARFRQEVFTAQLKSKHSWIKWTLAGVCMFLDVVAT